MRNLHSVEFTDEELEIIETVGEENEDYAICAVFDHRSDAEIDYDEDEGAVTIIEDELEVRQTIGMITEVCESDDPIERIGVGVSMLEVAINFEKQWRES